MWGRADAPPLLLLHGYPLTRAAWTPVLAALSKDFRAIAPDLPGHGASPAGEGAPSIDAMAEAVLALADRLECERFDLVGHSLGGYVAFGVLRRAKDRVRRLALVTTKATPDSPEAKEARRRQADLLEREGPRGLARALIPKLFREGAGEIAIEEARRMVEGNNVTGLVRALEAMRERPDSTPLLRSIAQPTLIVAGADDRVMPRSEQERMAKEIPGATLVVLAQSGHMPMIEEPGPLVEALARHFL